MSFVTLAMLTLIVARTAAAQWQAMIGADSRLTAAAGGMPAFTAGGNVLLGGATWTARATLEGAVGDRGWGYQGEYAVRTVGHVGFAARGTAERPIDRGAVGEQTAFLAVTRKSGRATFIVDAGGLVTRSELGVGGIAGATVTLGEFEISAEAGRFQMVTTGGGITGPTQPGGLTDTLAPAPEPAASPSQVPGALSHAALAGRWRRGVLELSARVLSRSAVAGSGSIGWLAGLALGPFNGVRLRAGVGDVPSGSALYMPNRKQALFGFEIARIPRLRNGSIPEPVAAKAAAFVVVFRDGIAVLEVTDLRAGLVEISADFTDWQPVAMVPAAGVWRHQQGLAPGTYRINVRFDGGAWQVPVGLPTVDDEFGGEVGLLVVGT